MRYQSFISPFVAFSLSLPAYCLSHMANHPTTLSPINIGDFEAAVGIQRRASKNFSDLDPATQARLVYGGPGESGQLLLADMTLRASDGLDIVMMEKFEGLTTKVDCKGDDGSMSLTFKSEQAFNQALTKWNFINKAEEEQFLLIANHDGCGPDDERQPYIITKIQEDKPTLTTHLTARPAPWSEIARDFDIDFGKVLAKPASHRRVKNRGLIRRDPGDKINRDLESFGNMLLGNADITHAWALPFSVSKTTNLVDNEDHIKIDCINCFIAGKFILTGHLKVKHLKIKDFVIEASPEDVQAGIELETTISGSSDLVSIDESKELVTFAVPDAGFVVKGIINLGATVSYSVGVGASFEGTGVFDLGLTASLPNSAKVTADLQNRDRSAVVGFDGFSFNPTFDVKSLTASIDLAAYSKAKIMFGIDVINIEKLDVTVTFEVPKVTTTLTAAFDEQGVCSTDPGSSKTGVKLDSNIALDVNLEVNANLGSKSDPVASVPLFSRSKPLLAKCFPVDIPGLGPVSSSTQTSSLPALETSQIAAPSSPSPPADPTVTISSLPSGTVSGVYMPVIPTPTESLTIPSGAASIIPTPTESLTIPSGAASIIPIPTESLIIPSGVTSIIPTPTESLTIPSGVTSIIPTPNESLTIHSGAASIIPTPTESQAIPARATSIIPTLISPTGEPSGGPGPSKRPLPHSTRLHLPPKP